MNESLFRFLNNFAGQNNFFDTLFWFLADFLVLGSLVALAYFIITAHDRQKAIKSGVIIFFSALLAWAFADMIKYIFPSPRPFVALDSINSLFEYGNYDSFPSGHTAFLAAFAFAFMFYSRRIGILMLFLAFIVGTTRVISGVHWPIDIAGGFLLGGGFALLVRYSYLKYQKHYGTPHFLE